MQLESLTAEQRAAATCTHRRLLILAGAGSGKTRTLIARVQHLVQQGTAPEQILMLTFTLRAAREMLARLQQLGPASAGLWAGTFHALALQTLRSHGKKIGLQPGWSVAGPDEQQDLMERALKSSRLQGLGGASPKALIDLGSLAINTQRSVAEVCAALSPAWSNDLEAVHQALDHYAQLKAQADLLDFDDLLLLFKALLLRPDDAPPVLSFEHVLVDEYQDTTSLQAELCELVCGAQAHLAVVGDDAQSIYGFRGAEVRNILDFGTQAPCETVRLTQSFRCQPKILHVAQGILQNNRQQFHTPLRSALADGPPVVVVQAAHPEQQAAFISHRIGDLLAAGLPAEQIAVLYRTHTQAEPISEALSRAAILYQVRGSTQRALRTLTRDALAYLRLRADPCDAGAWSRVLKIAPGVGEKTHERVLQALPTSGVVELEPLAERLTTAQAGALRRLEAALQPLQNPSLTAFEALQVLLRGPTLHQTGFGAHIEAKFPEGRRAEAHLQGLLSQAERANSLQDLLSTLALDPDAGRNHEAGVQLSTVHQAKGLEWSTVFVAGLSEGGFPLRYALDEPDGVQQERRLLYVALTRAKDSLYLCYPEASSADPGAAQLAPSRYLFEFDGSFVERWSVA